MSSGPARIVAAAAIGVALLVVLASTGPTPPLQFSGALRRSGGVCLTLEKWGLTGWHRIGETRTVADIQNGRWHESPVEPCADVPRQTYLIRPPFDARNGSYRICGSDGEPCIEFERIDFVSDGPGP